MAIENNSVQYYPNNTQTLNSNPTATSAYQNDSSNNNYQNLSQPQADTFSSTSQNTEKNSSNSGKKIGLMAAGVAILGGIALFAATRGKNKKVVEKGVEKAEEITFNNLIEKRTEYESKFWKEKANKEVTDFLEKHKDNPDIKKVFESQTADTRRFHNIVGDLIKNEKDDPEKINDYIKHSSELFLKEEAELTPKEKALRESLEKPEYQEIFDNYKHENVSLNAFVRYQPSKEQANELFKNIIEDKQILENAYRKNPKFLIIQELTKDAPKEDSIKFLNLTSEKREQIITENIEKFQKLSPEEQEKRIQKSINGQMNEKIKFNCQSMGT